MTSFKDTISEKDIGKAMELIFDREKKSYELFLIELTDTQQRCLVGLAKVGGKSPNSIEFSTETGIKLPSAITKTLNKLVKMRMIFRYGKEYRFANPFFREWLLYKNI